LGNVVISTTVHDRGCGYSNSFTLCRGCTLYPHQPINPPGYHHGPSYISMRGSDNRSKPPSISLSTGAYPMEFTSPARPGSTSFRASPRRHGGRTQVSFGRINPKGSRFTIAHKLAATRIPESCKPLYSMRLPALRANRLQTKPVPYRVMWLHYLIASSDYKETPMPFSETTNSFLP
jgi:hypothetical protein